MIELVDLAKSLLPKKTVVFLGAGASIPSGGPSGLDLCTYLEENLASGERISDDLMELSSILESRYGRESLIQKVRDILKPLRPSGGLLVLPEYDWSSIYTTNYDTLIESAYHRCGKKIIPIRSNYEYGKIEVSEGVPYFKLHGCVKLDIVDGHKARIVLTERDYDNYEKYRETLYMRLKLDFNSKNVVFIGYSLKDPHLRKELKIAARLHKEADTPGNLYALIYNKDVDRANLLSDQGFQVAFGSVDELMNHLSSSETVHPVVGPNHLGEFQLPISIRSSTLNVEQEVDHTANINKMFNGYSSSYGDIKQGFTFERSVEEKIINVLEDGKLCVTIIGVAGVGKTTLARRIAFKFCEKYYVWEHKSDFPFIAKPWLEVEASLREKDLGGVLLVDNCPYFQRQINILFDSLGKIENPAIRIMLVAERSQWIPRSKSRFIFSTGFDVSLSQLDEAEIERLVNLIYIKPEIKSLIEDKFVNLPKKSQIYTIKRKCSADMFVSLKHIFAFEGLDTIILREYSELPDELRDIYRTVAALESAGTRVHRQLIIRLLGVNVQFIKHALNILEGLVDEYDIKEDEGIYGWRTRHEVVAKTLSRFKYSDQEELFGLLDAVIDSLNATLWIERRTSVDLCNSEFGIRRLVFPEHRLKLYNQLIENMPGERVPRHRLIYELLQLEYLEQAEQAIRDAENSVGVDSPIYRYKILLLVKRARNTEGILLEDRRALLNEAYNLAIKGLEKFESDKYVYMIFESIGWAFYDLTKNVDKLDEAIEILKRGVERVLDPQLSSRLAELERQRVPLG